MSSGLLLVSLPVLLLLSAVLFRFLEVGEFIQCAFPSRAGFRGAGVVAVQGEKGLRWIEAQQGGGANGKVCGYAAALSGEAVRMFADSKVGGGRGDAFVAGIKGGEYGRRCRSSVPFVNMLLTLSL